MFSCRLKIYLSLTAPPGSLPPATSEEAAALDEADQDLEKDFYSIAEALKCKALKTAYYNGCEKKCGELEGEGYIDFDAGDLDAAAEAVKILLEARKEAQEGKLADRLWLFSRVDRLEFWS